MEPLSLGKVTKNVNHYRKALAEFADFVREDSGNYRLRGEISDDLGKAAKQLDAAATALGQAFGDLMAASAHMTEKQRKDAEFDVLPPSN
jgi:hypothetical protein